MSRVKGLGSKNEAADCTVDMRNEGVGAEAEEMSESKEDG